MATDSPLNNLPVPASESLQDNIGQPKTPSPNSAHCDKESAQSDLDSNSNNGMSNSHNSSTSPNAVSSEPKNPNNSTSASLLKNDKTSATSNASAHNEKRPLFIRFWSEDDELTILNLWIEYWSKEGHDPDTDTFYELVKNLVPTKKVTKSQLMDKFRKLKKKYLNFVTKFGHREDPNSFQRIHPHELKLFELSKKIWGDVDAIDKVKTGKRKVVESNYGDNKSNKRIQEIVVEEEDSLGKERMVFGFGIHDLRRPWRKRIVLDIILSAKRLGIRKLTRWRKWKYFQVQEAKHKLLWLELVKEQTELILDVLNKKI